MTKTFDNLQEAFAGESQANRATWLLPKWRMKLASRRLPGCSGPPRMLKLFIALNHLKAAGLVKTPRRI